MVGIRQGKLHTEEHYVIPSSTNMSGRLTFSSMMPLLLLLLVFSIAASSSFGAPLEGAARRNAHNIPSCSGNSEIKLIVRFGLVPLITHDDEGVNIVSAQDANIVANILSAGNPNLKDV